MRAGRSLVKTDDRDGAALSVRATRVVRSNGQQVSDGLDASNEKTCGLIEDRAAGIATGCATI